MIDPPCWQVPPPEQLKERQLHCALLAPGIVPPFAHVPYPHPSFWKEPLKLQGTSLHRSFVGELLGSRVGETEG